MLVAIVQAPALAQPFIPIFKAINNLLKVGNNIQPFRQGFLFTPFRHNLSASTLLYTPPFRKDVSRTSTTINPRQTARALGSPQMGTNNSRNRPPPSTEAANGELFS
jgi:hypothetical protein